MLRNKKYFKSPASMSSLFINNFLQPVCVITGWQFKVTLLIQAVVPDGFQNSISETDDGVTFFIILTLTSHVIPVRISLYEIKLCWILIGQVPLFILNTLCIVFFLSQYYGCFYPAKNNCLKDWTKRWYILAWSWMMGSFLLLSASSFREILSYQQDGKLF